MCELLVTSYRNWTQTSLGRRKFSFTNWKVQGMWGWRGRRRNPQKENMSSFAGKEEAWADRNDMSSLCGYAHFTSEVLNTAPLASSVCIFSLSSGPWLIYGIRWGSCHSGLPAVCTFRVSGPSHHAIRSLGHMESHVYMFQLTASMNCQTLAKKPLRWLQPSHCLTENWVRTASQTLARAWHHEG